MIVRKTTEIITRRIHTWCGWTQSFFLLQWWNIRLWLCCKWL